MDDSRTCQRCGRTYRGGGYKFCQSCGEGYTGRCAKCGREFPNPFGLRKRCYECHRPKGAGRGTATCPQCGREFPKVVEDQVFCSKECYERSRARTPDACPQCGKGVPKGRKYCSDECWFRANGTIRVCQRCGREFHKASNGKVPKYCSNECAHEAQIRRPMAVCQQCGKEYRVSRNAKGLYCSPECQQESMRVSHESEKGYFEAVRWMERVSRAMAREDRPLIATVCNQCERTFVTTNRQARYCSDRCRRRHANNRKEDRLYWYGKPDLSVTLEKLFVRGGGRCAECGLLMTFSSPFNSDEHPSIDHIVPLSKGGTHTWDNVQLMCRGCNRKKSDTFGGTFAQGMTWFEA